LAIFFRFLISFSPPLLLADTPFSLLMPLSRHYAIAITPFITLFAITLPAIISLMPPLRHCHYCHAITPPLISWPALHYYAMLSRWLMIKA
jgi:hypothetical protein